MDVGGDVLKTPQRLNGRNVAAASSATPVDPLIQHREPNRPNNLQGLSDPIRLQAAQSWAEFVLPGGSHPQDDGIQDIGRALHPGNDESESGGDWQASTRRQDLLLL